LVTQEPMQRFTIVAFFHLTNSGRYVKFTPIHSIV
jgi:hypothetical protein